MRRNPKLQDARVAARLALVTALPGYERLTDPGRVYVEAAITSPPSRVVGRGSLMSVSGAVVHPKFPDAVVYESVCAEKPYIQLAAISGQIVDILAQPPQLQVLAHDSVGRRSHRKYTPDFIEFDTTCFAFVEAKRQADLEKLAAESPDWAKDSAGNWHYLPAEQIADRFGMAFRVFNPDTLSKPYIANLDVLSRISLAPLNSSEQLLVRRIVREVSIRPRTVRELCAVIAGLTGPLIVRSIIAGKTFGHIDSQLIDPNFVVYASRDDAPFARRALNSTDVSHCQVGEMQKRLDSASKKEIEVATGAQRRYDERRLSGAPLNSTDYRFKAKIEEAQSQGAMRLAAFVPKFRERGGKGRPIASEVRSAIVTHTIQMLTQAGQANQSKLYADFKCVAEAAGFNVPSPETHRRIITSEFSGEREGFLTGGKRGFHSNRPQVDGKDANPRLAIGGLHVHIDGYTADVRAVSDDGVDRGRLIFYPLIDDMSGYVLALGMKLGQGSTPAVMMALRDCIARHGGLPAVIHHDWGSEFINHAVETSAARLGISLSRRPPSAARFGGKGEMFNAQLSTFLGGLPGSTLPDQRGRSVDASKKSRATAALSVEEIIRATIEWIFEIWNRSPIGSQARTPEELWKESIQIFPTGLIPQVDCMTMLFNTSSPLVKRKVDPRKGVSVGTRKFVANELSNMLRSGEQPSEYRLDSMNPAVVYALTRRGPIELRSPNYHSACGATLGQRVCMFDDLLLSKSRANKNQVARNVSEARLLQSLRKTAGSAQSTHALTTHLVEPTTPARKDFTRAIGATPRTFTIMD